MSFIRRSMLNRRKPVAKPMRSRLMLRALEDRLAPATLVVSLTGDGAGNTLRNQIIAANNNGVGVDTITFDPAVFTSAKTITLTAGEIAISSNLVIQGPAAALTISGNNSSRIFNINGAGTLAVSIQDVTLTKGAATGANDGGAIFVQDENLTLTNCTLSSNNSASDGGAIRLEAVGAKLTLDTCVVSSNTATSAGGAISAANGPTVTIANTTFSGNTATAGGAMNMFQGGSLLVDGSTFAFNFTNSSDGGGLFLNGVFSTATIRNSTFGGNQAVSDGGAIAFSSSFSGTLTVQSSTIANNTTVNDNGGGIARTGGTGTVSLTSSIVFGNIAGGTGNDLFTTGTVNAAVSLIGTKTGVTTFSPDAFTNTNLGVDPLLGGFANNGGPTATRLPAAGSKAINNGSNPAGATNDQRGVGYFRVRGKAADIGAVELPDDFVVSNTNNSGAGSLRQAILDANTAVGSDTIVFDSTFTITKTITLTTGELLISDNVLLTGPTARINVHGNNSSRVFSIDGTNPLVVGLSDVNILNGKVSGLIGGAGLRMSDDTVSLTRCSIQNNVADIQGGGINTFIASGGSLTLTDCAVVGNSCGGNGGGLFVSAPTLVLVNTTVSGNSGVDGGGIYSFGGGTFTVRNSTVSGNSASGNGGGIHLKQVATLVVQNSTITNNSAASGSGGGIHRLSTFPINIDSSIVFGNSAGSAAQIFSPGTVTANTSLIGSKSGVTTFTGDAFTNSNIGVDPLLGPLQANGGTNLTHLPALNSPALGKGSNPAGLTTDQRGTNFPRARGGSVDIGAVEMQQLVVTNNSPSGAGSLNQAVLDSNAFSGIDTITFDSTVFATTQTINLAGTLNFTTDADIIGPTDKVILSGQLLSRQIFVNGGLDYHFSNLSFVFGKATSDGGAILLSVANALLDITNCAFSFNTTSTEGGAIGLTANNITANLTDCTFNNNTTTGATQDGGAIHADSKATLTLVRTAFTSNTATGDGGAISLPTTSNLTVRDSTLSGNKASLTGGGISLNGTAGVLKILNSTLSGNTSSQDGGGLSWVSSSGTLTIQNSTITNNTASAGGGGGLSVTSGTGSLNIESTIVSGNSNSGAPDIDNPNTTTLKTSAVGDNLGFVKTDAGGNLPFQPHANLKLGVLTNNGGPTNTHLPAFDSPLRNVGSNPSALTTDQRGFDRFLSGGIDIGSAEHFDAIVRNTSDAAQDSLRDVIADANAIPGANTITFDPVVFASAKTITLTSGQLTITENVTIDGPTVGVTISGNSTVRILDVGGSSALSFAASHLTLTKGTAGSGGGAAIRAGDDSIVLTDCVLTGNIASVSGGGAVQINQGGVLSATRCTFSANSAGGFGGAIDVFGGPNSALLLQDCTVSGNSTGIFGGGIYAIHKIQLINSTVSGNMAPTGSGGGLVLRGYFTPGLSLDAVIVNSTISGNSASIDGGGILLDMFSGNIAISSCTFADNTANNRGGAIALSAGSGSIGLDSTIIQGNTAGTTGPDIFTAGTVNVTRSLVGSKAGVTTFSGDVFTNANIGVSAKLGPLQNNGGPTLTYLPALDSPAFNNGNSIFGLPTDQRGAGFPRAIGGVADIGAVEIRLFQVLNTNDSGIGSLRQAIIDSNALAGMDTIVFDPAVFGTAKTITLTTGELTISDDVTITGPSVGVTVSGNNASRIFNIDGTGTLNVAISDLGMAGGNATGSTDGGAILVQNEIVSLTRCTLSQNKATNGAGIFLAAAGAELTLRNSTVSANFAGNNGGAIGALGSAAILIQDSSIFGNSAQVGGGLHQAGGGSLTVIGSTFSGNSASGGGGGGVVLFNSFSTAIVRNSTISSNTALGGGGISLANSFFGTLIGQNSTITSNTSTGGLSGGGIDSAVGGTGIMTLTSTIVSGNSSATAPDIRSAGTVNVTFSAIGSNAGFTLSGSSGNNLAFGANLKLSALGINGGPTLTHLPAVDSPLVNAGSNPAALTTDQRGFSRVQGIGIEIGAIESRSLVVTNINDAGIGSLRQNILDANAFPGVDTITFDPTVFATANTIKLSNGELAIADDLTISGPTVGVTIDAQKLSRVIRISNGDFNPVNINVALSRLTVTGGSTNDEDGGAGILNYFEIISLDHCVITGNSLDDSAPFSLGGGGIQTLGNATLTNCVISGNTAARNGGGISNQTLNAEITIINCVIADNVAGLGGGGVLTGNGILTMRSSTISGNKSGANGAGGVNTGGDIALIQNCTFSNNTTTGDGGAISQFGSSGDSVTIQNCTFTQNMAGAGKSGGGLFVAANSDSSIAIESTIFFANSAAAGTEISAPAVTAKTSLIGSKIGITTLTADAFTNSNIGVDPLLGPLQNNGGPTLSHLPALNSPALSNGSNPSGLSADQRGIGFPRARGSSVDIGAVEVHQIVVANSNNAGASTLRQAIIDSNAATGTDTVTFDPSVFSSPLQIILTTGSINMSDAVVIAGPAVGVTIDGNDNGRIFQALADDDNVAMSNLTLTGGKVASGGGSALLANCETVTLTNCTITGNEVTAGAGGAIAVGFGGSSLTLVNCTVSNNISSSDGGGISMANAGHKLTILNSTISGNSAANRGGGVFIRGDVVIRNCTISGNTAGFAGGGILAELSSIAIVQNSTITNNIAVTGGGGGLGLGVTLANIDSSIVFGNTANTGFDIAGPNFVTTTSLIGNITGATSFTGDAFTNANVGVDPLLGALANNGGPVLTHLPAFNSPAVNKGSNPAGLLTDARGAARDVGGVDIGAVELPTALVVTNANDNGPGSLRVVVASANASIGTDFITFDPVFFATAKKITLTTGQLNIAEGLFITGPSAGLTLSGNKVSGILNIDNGVDSSTPVHLTGLTFIDGVGAPFGGAIFAEADLTIQNCTFKGNSASDDAGAIAIIGRLTMTDSSVVGNTSGDFGGGIAVAGDVVIERSLIAGNTAVHGGGLSALANTIVIRNSTISGNNASNDGGGIDISISNASITIQNSTIANNSAGVGGGGIDASGASTITLESSIVATNTSGGGLPDIFCNGPVSAKNSAIGKAAGFILTDLGGNLPFDTNLKLGPLTNNGGPTQTHALQFGSPAIDKGSNPAGLTTDQRGAGFARVIGGTADIGAFEFTLPPTVTKIEVNGGGIQRSMVTSMVVTFSEAVSFPSGFNAGLQVNRTGPGGPIGQVTLAFNQVGNVVTITFNDPTFAPGISKSLIDGNYRLDVNSERIFGIGGQLDGNGNGIHEGSPTDDRSQTFHRLFGDGNGDRSVTAADFNQFRLDYGLTGQSFFDFDGDNQVTASDFNQFRTRFGITLP